MGAGRPRSPKGWRFEQLWVNGKRATRARTPQRFFDYMLEVTEEVLEQGDGRIPLHARQTITVDPSDLTLLQGLSTEELRDIILVAYHKWDTTHRFLEAVDLERGALVISGPGMKPWNVLEKGTGYYLENVPTACNVPGNWFLTRDGKLSYCPLPEEDMSSAEVVAPLIEKFIILAGESDAEAYVEHLTFQNLSFQHAQWLTPAKGSGPEQAASGVDAVVMADGAQHIRFEGCEISHFGTYGMWFRHGCRHNVIQQCYLHDCGGWRYPHRGASYR